MARTAKENIRERILEAAEKRLWHYGIKKTTIDEIAADAGVGKGTVYLYFDSKEDISLAILSGYKLGMLAEQDRIVRNPEMGTVEKIRNFLLLPALTAHERCNRCPEAMELMIELKPHLAEHLRPFQEEEIRLLAQILIEGNTLGVLNVQQPEEAARSLKTMTWGLFPHYPFVNKCDSVEQEIASIVSLVVRGLRADEGRLKELCSGESVENNN